MLILAGTSLLLLHGANPQAPTQAAAPAVYVKEIRPGIVYRQEIRANVPLIIHSLTFKYPSEGVRLETALGGFKVLGNGQEGRSTVTQLARGADALAAINGDFFYPNGDPTGLFVHHSELLSEPYRPRSVVAWTDENLFFDTPSWSCSLLRPGGKALKVDGINRVAKDGEIVLVTERGGTAKSHRPAMMFVFEVATTLIPGSSVEATFKHVVPEVTSLPVKRGQFVAVATGYRTAEMLEGIEQNTKYIVSLSLIGSKDWAKVKFALSGGPRLLADGRIMLNAPAEGFNNDLSASRHPRTAVGIKPTGEVVLVVVDGRSPISVGATLRELATILLNLGCQDAINLDGGGSSALCVAGNVVNRPSDGRERPVANGLLLFAPGELPRVKAVGIAVPSNELTVGDVVRLSVLTADGDSALSEDVLWICESAEAWIDQGGNLTAMSPGKAVVRAVVRGSEAQIELTILPKTPQSSKARN